MKTRIKSYSFWTSLSAAVILLVNSIGNMFGFSIEDKLISNIIMSTCGVLVVLGVVSAPTKADEKESEELNEANEEEVKIEDDVQETSEKDLKKN